MTTPPASDGAMSVADEARKPDVAGMAARPAESETVYKADNTGLTTGTMCFSFDAMETIVFGGREKTDIGPFFGSGSAAFDECHVQGTAFNSEGTRTIVSCQSVCTNNAFLVSYHSTGHRDDLHTFLQTSPVSGHSSTFLSHPSSTQFLNGGGQFPIFLGQKDDKKGEHGSRLFMIGGLEWRHEPPGAVGCQRYGHHAAQPAHRYCGVGIERVDSRRAGLRLRLSKLVQVRVQLDDERADR